MGNGRLGVIAMLDTENRELNTENRKLIHARSRTRTYNNRLRSIDAVE